MMRYFKRIALCCMPLIFMAGCAYNYEPAAGVEPAFIKTRAVRLVETAPDKDATNFSAHVFSINRNVISVVPESINSSWPDEVAFDPGKTALKVSLIWPNAGGSQTISIPFIAQKNGHYHMTLSKSVDGKHQITILDGDNNVAQAVMFLVQKITTFSVPPPS